MRPISTALASFGMSGEVFHAPFLTKENGYLLHAVVERQTKKAQMLYPSVISHSSFDALLSDQNVELVVVNTPNNLHYSMAKQALLAGKHVLVEKPFTVTVAEGRELITLAKVQKLILSVFQSRRWDADFLTVKKILREKKIGNPVELIWHFDRYRTNITPKKWKEDDVPGAGVLFDLGVHLIDYVIQLFGMPHTVSCELRTLRAGAGAPDHVHLRFGYGQLSVTLHSSTMVREKGPTIALHGDKGSFVKYGTDPQEQQLKDGLRPGDPEYGEEKEAHLGILHTEADGEVIRTVFPSETGCYQKYFEVLYNAIRHNGPLPVDPEEGLLNVALIHLGLKSHKEQRTIAVELNNLEHLTLC